MSVSLYKSTRTQITRNLSLKWQHNEDFTPLTNKLLTYLEEPNSQIALEESNTKHLLEVNQIVKIFFMQFCVSFFCFIF
jgi:hypothetical protein